PVQILTFMGGEVKVPETELKPRVGFLYPVITHNISIFINATRERDSGQYIGHPHGTPAVGANVTLSCFSEKGKPPPIYRWKRMAPSPDVFFPPAQDEAKGTLKLTNLSL
ncbi:Endothelial cell-selective adhesion molecule, partial [Buceros rhinoceros silvestris]